MGLFDLALAPLHAVFGSAERDIAEPVRDIENIETRVLGTAEAIRQATESIESHVEVIETLAGSIAPLTESVNRLTEQMAGLNHVLAPLSGAERDVSRLEHLFGRGRSAAKPPADSAAKPPADSAPKPPADSAAKPPADPDPQATPG